MKFTLYVIRYFLITFHIQYIRLLYRVFIKLSHNFGLAVMVRSFFKPLFGFPGVLSRINGVVIRSISIIASSLILLLLIIVGLSGYLLIILSPFYITYKAPLMGLLYVSGIIALKRYDYFKRPLSSIKDTSDINQYFESGGQGLRYIMNEIKTENFNVVIDTLRENKYIDTYTRRLELSEHDLFEFIYSNKTKLKRDLIYKNIIGLNEKIKFTHIKAELILCAILVVVDPDESYLNSKKLDIEMLTESLFFTKHIYSKKSHIWDDNYVLPPSGGIDKGWAIGYTGNLNKYGEDLTKLALEGYMPELVGRGDTKKQVVSILSKNSRNNLLLTGDPGCGKTTFVKALANEIANGTSIPALRYKRLISLDIGSLTAGDIGEINDRLSKILKEIKSAGNIILFIDEIHTLSSTLSSDPNSAVVFSTLEPHLSNGEFQIIGTTSRSNYYKYISPNGSFSKVFDLVEMPETTKEETVEIVALNIKKLERKTGIVLSAPAVYAAYDLAQKHIHNRALPDKVVELVQQAYADKESSKDKLISRDNISETLAKSINIPIGSLSDDESEILIHIEERLHKKIIGQDLAVKSISNALKRGRLGIRDTNKPIASFIFAGPTGVGKTETAKAIAEIYFGDKQYLIRVDMSEYQSSGSMDRLIGTNSEPGILTSKVRTNPYSLVLLDEIEKSDKSVQNLFLQVLDDGRLTSTDGVLVDFSNTMIIMTSNIGTREVIDALDRHADDDDIHNIIIESLKGYFSPEFLNRFTGLIPYKPLSDSEINKIARLKLDYIKSQMKEKKINVEFSDNLVNELVAKGYSREWGARPLNRVIEDSVETHLANLLLRKKLLPGSTYTMTQLISE